MKADMINRKNKGATDRHWVTGKMKSDYAATKVFAKNGD
jgi:hypothetical protein